MIFDVGSLTVIVMGIVIPSCNTKSLIRLTIFMWFTWIPIMALYRNWISLYSVLKKFYVGFLKTFIKF